MQCPVMKRMLFIQEQIFKEQFQELCCFMDSVFQIVVFLNISAYLLTTAPTGHTVMQFPQ